jgi:hypothetical protein
VILGGVTTSDRIFEGNDTRTGQVLSVGSSLKIEHRIVKLLELREFEPLHAMHHGFV